MPMSRPVIVVHYHELWLKGRNRNFFLGKLAIALRRALEGIAFTKIGRPGDRMIVELGEGAPVAEALARLARVSGISSYAGPRCPRASGRPRADLPYRDYAGACACVRAENSRSGRIARQQRRTHDVSAL